MTKKLIVVAALVAVVSGGAFAQLTLGVTGALHMDQQLSADAIANSFKTGDNIYYGGFAEIIGKHVGLGGSANYSPVAAGGAAPLDLTNWDANIYLSYHLFGGRAFLDPFAEVGGGLFFLDYTNASEKPAGGTLLIAASPYWYGALGLGVNLGPIGVFGKFAYNMVIQRQLMDSSTNTPIPYYGNYVADISSAGYHVVEYVPQYRFTLGLKLIL